jgi:hypothetical protein
MQRTYCYTNAECENGEICIDGKCVAQ